MEPRRTHFGGAVRWALLGVAVTAGVLIGLWLMGMLDTAGDVIRGSGVWIASQDGSRGLVGDAALPLKTRILVGEKGRAHVRLREGAVLTVAARTIFSVQRPETGVVRVNLARGRVTATAVATQRLAVRTPNVTASAAGARFGVRHRGEVTRLGVDNGLAEVVFARGGRRERVEAGEEVAASGTRILAAGPGLYWREDFERPPAPATWVAGFLVPAEEAPQGNGTTACFRARADRDDNRLRATLSDARCGLLFHHPDLVLRFRCYASTACRWMGLWLMTDGGRRLYLSLPVAAGRWVRREVPLRDARPPDGGQSLRSGEVVTVLSIQGGPADDGSLLFVDDVSLHRLPGGGYAAPATAPNDPPPEEMQP